MRLALAFLLLASAASAQDLSKTVVPISKIKFYGPVQAVRFGTGFCVDPDCRFVGTNYHVAKAMGRHFKVEGDPVVAVWLGTGPGDEGATENKVSGPLGRLGLGGSKYSMARDIAVVELRWPLSKKGYHGIPFAQDDPDYGAPAEIWSFPLNWNPKRRLVALDAKFVGYNVKYATRPLDDLSDKPLLFEYDQSEGKLRGGASGGLVVAGGKVVGILNSVTGKEMPHTAGAISTQAFAAFLASVQPYLSATVFPKSVVIPPAEADRNPEWVPERGSGKRPAEPPDVQALRAKAQQLSDQMKDFIATETFEWGRGNRSTPPEAVAKMEVRVIDGVQRFFDWPDGKKAYDEVPEPAPLNRSISPAGEWAETPNYVGNYLKLKIRRAADIQEGGRTFRVYQWRAEAEDNICKLDTINEYMLFTTHHVDTVSCYGEVWTDEDLNIVRASESYNLLGKWRQFHGIVTYGVVDVAGRETRLPLTVTVQAMYGEGGKLYWCDGIYTDYRRFGTTVRIGESK
jgi:hypothetical protein